MANRKYKCRICEKQAKKTQNCLHNRTTNKKLHVDCFYNEKVKEDLSTYLNFGCIISMNPSKANVYREETENYMHFEIDFLSNGKPNNRNFIYIPKNNENKPLNKTSLNVYHTGFNANQKAVITIIITAINQLTNNEEIFQNEVFSSSEATSKILIPQSSFFHNMTKIEIQLQGIGENDGNTLHVYLENFETQKPTKTNEQWKEIV